MAKMKYIFDSDDAWRFAREQGIPVRTRGQDELIFAKCPYCGNTSSDRDKFSISLKTGQFNCLRESCGVTGNMITLSKDFNFSLGRDIDEYYRTSAARSYYVFPKRDKPIEPKDMALEYMKKRGISEDICRKYQITSGEVGGTEVIVFPFIDDKNQIQFAKYRNPNPKPGQGKEFTQANCKPILFGMHQCNLDNKTLIITEGQIDSLSVAEAGIENAVSVPTGAKGFTWVPHCWDWMQNFDKIIVFGDHEHEHITLFNDIAARWKYKAWHVREEDYLDCKDANEILQKYGPEQIKKCIDGAVQKSIPKAKSLSKVEYIDPYEIEKLPTGFFYLDTKILHGGLPFGQVVLVTGKAGDGKSTLASQILLNGIHYGYKCFAYSGELPESLFKSWIDYQAAGLKHTYEAIVKWQPEKVRKVNPQDLKKIMEWYDGKFWIYDNTLSDEEEDEETGLIELLEQVINQYGVRVILIDNLMTGLDLEDNSSQDKYEKQSLFVKKLARTAIQYDVLIILVAHKRKDNGSASTNDSVSGSSDIANLASIVISYERSNREGITKDMRILKVSKNRLFGTLIDDLEMHYEAGSKRIYNLKQEKDREYGWNKIGKEQKKEPELAPPPWEDED